MTGCIVEYDQNRKIDYDTDDRVTFPKFEKVFETFSNLRVKVSRDGANFTRRTQEECSEVLIKSGTIFCKIGYRYSESTYCENN